MPSQAYQRFQENRQDIDTIWKIHDGYSGKKNTKGKRPKDLDVLNRAAVVFIAACWESFIEDLMEESIEFLVTKGNDPSKMPPKLMGEIGKQLKSLENDKSVWDLAGEGWKKIVTEKWKGSYEEWKEKFHSPKTENIEEYIKDCIGLRTIHEKWKWKRIQPKKASEKLDEFMKVRGEIAHRTKSERKINKTYAQSFLKHIANLVKVTEDIVTSHLHKSTGTIPFSQNPENQNIISTEKA